MYATRYASISRAAQHRRQTFVKNLRCAGEPGRRDARARGPTLPQLQSPAPLLACGIWRPRQRGSGALVQRVRQRRPRSAAAPAGALARACGPARACPDRRRTAGKPRARPRDRATPAGPRLGRALRQTLRWCERGRAHIRSAQTVLGEPCSPAELAANMCPAPPTDGRAAATLGTKRSNQAVTRSLMSARSTSIDIA